MRKLSEESKIIVFADDIAKINSKEIAEFVKAVLVTFPEYFWTQPASTTGRYHPVCTLRESGLLVHTKRVIFFGEKLSRAHISPYYRGDKSDILMAACILHDGQKGGKGLSTYDDYENHPLLVSKRFVKMKSSADMEYTDWMGKIFDCIAYHMGPWTPELTRKPMSEYTELEIITYHADYLATQKDLQTPVDNFLESMNLVYEEV
jgi:hypothetical protein